MEVLRKIESLSDLTATREGISLRVGANEELNYSFDEYKKIRLGLMEKDGKIEFSIGGEKCSEQSQGYVGNAIGFDKLIDIMNMVLKQFGFNEVSETGTPLTYAYLYNADSKATEEWFKSDSWMFRKDTYKDVYDWHGSETKYRYIAFNSLTAWLMAMCMSELCPTAGQVTNCQTELFKMAYVIGGGMEVPLYGLEIHANPMVSRRVGGFIYVINHWDYSFADLDNMRLELGGNSIAAADWNGLRYVGNDNVGYLVNTDIIIPAAPGPYANGFTERTKPYEQGQPKDLFHTGEVEKDWYLNNYKMDCVIDNYVVANYNMQAQTTLSLWNSYTKQVKQRIIEVCSTSRATDHYFFGKKTVKFDGIKKGSRAGNYKDYLFFLFSETTEKPTATNDVFEISGPFADLESKMFVGSGFGTKTSALKYFNDVMDIYDNSRFPTFHNQYGRRRPCGGNDGVKGSSRSKINGDPLNGLYNIDLSCIFADSQENVDKWATEDGFVMEKPKSYPSGHTTMSWGVAMLLGQMNPNKLQQYAAAAYELGVSRVIGRAHWNSDIIYGRLVATMALPIINAMFGLRVSYESTKNTINTDTTPSGNTPGTVVSFLLNIKNTRNGDIMLDDKINFVLANPDKNGFYYGEVNGAAYTGYYNRWSMPLVGDGNKIRIPAGGEKSFVFRPVSETIIFHDGGKTVYGESVTNGFGGRNLVSKDQMQKNDWNASRGLTNVLLYVNGETNVIVPECMDSNVVFEDGKTYTLIIK